MKGLLRIFRMRECWRCRFRFEKKKMLLLFGGYVCRDCYIKVRPYIKSTLVTNNLQQGV